jgi:putative transcription factor
MDHQDWEPVVLKKSVKQMKKEMPKKLEREIKAKQDGGKNKQGKTDINMKKLDEADNPIIHTVSHSLKMEIQKARSAKKMTQLELAQKISENVNVVKNYENGTAIPDSKILNKLNRVLGCNLKKDKKVLDVGKDEVEEEKN